MKNEAQLSGPITAMEWLSPTHKELLIMVQTDNGAVRVIIDNIQAINEARALSLGDEVAVSGRLGGGSTVHAVEVT